MTGMIRRAALLAVVSCISVSAISRATPLAFVGTPRIESPGAPFAATGIAISADDLHIYTSSNAVDTLGTFGRDAFLGSVSLLGEIESGSQLTVADELTISNDGLHVYVSDIGVRIYSRNMLTGLLSQTGSIGAFGPGSSTVSPDDEHLYVCDPVGDSLVVYDRNTTSGALTFVEGETDGVGGVDGLDACGDVTISPDGTHVYAVGSDDDAVAVFSRNAGTGALTFVEVQKDGVGGVDGLFFARGIAVSPDGNHVYVGGENGLTAFARNGTTGALTFIEYAGTPPMNGQDRVLVSPDGTHVYATLTPGIEPGLAVFDRDAGTGEVTLSQTFEEGVGGVQGIGGSYDIAASADGQYVYVSGLLGTFRHTQLECSTAPMAGCIQTQPGQSKLIVKNQSPDTADTIKWKWGQGDDVALADFGDPATTLTDYALCLYDGSSAAFVDAVVPAGGGCGQRNLGGATSCWLMKSADGFSYRSKIRSPHGATAAKLAAGTGGTAKVSVKLKGENVPMPALPLSTPIVVQVQNSAGKCWEATFSSALVNDGILFRALSD